MSIQPTLAGLERPPELRTMRLTPDEKRAVDRLRVDKRFMERRRQQRLEHILANLPRQRFFAISAKRLHEKLNTGQLGHYTHSQVYDLLAELRANGAVLYRKNKGWWKCR